MADVDQVLRCAGPERSSYSSDCPLLALPAAGRHTSSILRGTFACLGALLQDRCTTEALLAQRTGSSRAAWAGHRLALCCRGPLRDVRYGTMHAAVGASLLCMERCVQGMCRPASHPAGSSVCDGCQRRTERKTKSGSRVSTRRRREVAVLRASAPERGFGKRPAPSEARWIGHVVRQEFPARAAFELRGAVAQRPAARYRWGRRQSGATPMAPGVQGSRPGASSLRSLGMRGPRPRGLSCVLGASFGGRALRRYFRRIGLARNGGEQKVAGPCQALPVRGRQRDRSMPPPAWVGAAPTPQVGCWPGCRAAAPTARCRMSFLCPKAGDDPAALQSSACSGGEHHAVRRGPREGPRGQAGLRVRARARW